MKMIETMIFKVKMDLLMELENKFVGQRHIITYSLQNNNNHHLIILINQNKNHQKIKIYKKNYKESYQILMYFL